MYWHLSPGRYGGNLNVLIFQHILMIDSWSVSCETALRWMAQDLTDK